jgi:pSer/pThr/pTyr-binding forkhead associated (FHA) protein
MDPTTSPPPEHPADPPRPVLGQLVVQNGRQAGACRPLTSALTVLGQAPHCDVRLNVPGVAPVHCVLAWGPDGFHLRHLGSAGGTLVNGQAVTECALTSGDHIVVGPFEFTFGLPEGGPVPGPSPADLQVEYEAVRIQAAAVVAQQAALAEEEARLRQQRAALQRQKEQLAAHLDGRRQDLLQLEEQVRQDRNALKAECAAARKEHDQLRDGLVQAREQVLQAQQRADKERRRCVELRRRLKRRWHRHWDAREADLLHRERKLLAEHDALRREAEALQRDRQALVQAQLRLNGEAELGRRRLQQEWEQLGLAQQQWEAVLNEEQRKREELRQSAAAVDAGARTLARQQREFDHRRACLAAELDGLETRVRNSRQKLFESEQRLARLELMLEGGASPAPAEHTAAPVGGELVPVGALAVPRARPIDVPAEWVRLAGNLADQRLHLVEQWLGLITVAQQWQADHAAALAAVEASGRDLAERERRLVTQERAQAAQEQAVAAADEEMRRRQQALVEVRYGLEAWQARLAARETAWASQREVVLAEVRLREEAAAALVARAEETAQRRARRRAEEVEEVRQALARCEELRQDYAALWQECQERRAALAREERGLAAQSMAVEHLRQELLGRAPEPAAASRRLERLRRRQAAAVAAEARSLAEQRQRQGAEAARLEERTRELQHQQAGLMSRQEEWSRRQAEAEDRRLAAARDEQHRHAELSRLRAVHEQDEKQIARLHEEVERIARLLLDEGEEPAAGPASQAA